MTKFKCGDEVVFLWTGELATICAVQWDRKNPKPRYSLAYFPGATGHNIEEDDIVLVDDIHRLLYR